MQTVKENIHLFLGCDVMIAGRNQVLQLVGIREDGYVILSAGNFKSVFPVDDIKPLLRPTNDMTDEETCEWFKLCQRGVARPERDAAATAFLLRNGFDVFEWIPAGLAIPKYLNYEKLERNNRVSEERRVQKRA